MNSPIPSGASLKRALLGMLRELLGEIGWLSELPDPLSRAGGKGPQAIVRLASDTGARACLHVHVKGELRPSTFSAWEKNRGADARRQHAVPILAMPSVSARLAELCRRANWSWLDLSGNCWLDVPGLLRVERSGNPRVHDPRRRGANLGTAAAARVMRVLLSPGHAGRSWTQRGLQAATCWRESLDRPVSLGLVNKDLRHLCDEGYVVDADDESGVRVRDASGLLRAWNEAYRFDRHERRSYFTLQKRADLHQALHRTGQDAGGAAVFAAFSAAERQAPQVRQPRTWLYVAAEFLDCMEEHTQAREVDSGENLVVLVPEDLGVFLSFEAEAEGHISDRSLGCTDPVQTWVDLLHCGGRGEEAAQAVLEQCILRRWKVVGSA